MPAIVLARPLTRRRHSTEWARILTGVSFRASGLTHLHSNTNCCSREVTPGERQQAISPPFSYFRRANRLSMTGGGGETSFSDFKRESTHPDGLMRKETKGRATAFPKLSAMSETYEGCRRRAKDQRPANVRAWRKASPVAAASRAPFVFSNVIFE